MHHENASQWPIINNHKTNNHLTTVSHQLKKVLILFDNYVNDLRFFSNRIKCKLLKYKIG